MSTPRQHGKAGHGLGSDSARKKFGSDAAVGAAGERYFAEALKSAGITGKYDVWYSLSIPNDPTNSRATKYRSDVDVAVSSGDRLILIDVKKWKPAFYWTIFGLPFRGMTPMFKNGQWRLSANMAGALARYRANLPGIQVEAIVVFIPTSARGAVPTVRFMKWPGGIRSYLSNDGIRKIDRFLKTKQETDPKVRGLLGRMVRR